MKKKDLVEELYHKSHHSLVDSRLLVDALLDEMKQTLLKGESVKIRGFGTFRVADKKGGMVRDFLNNTMKSSPGGRRIRFRLSPLLRSIHELHR